MRFARCLLLLCSLLWLSAPPVAQAQQTTSEATGAEPPGYRQLVADALAEYEAGHFEESRALMVRAYQQFPNARTLRGLGMVSFELRAYPESVEQLEQALASPLRPLTGELRAETEALLGRARSFVGTLGLQVSPSGAHVLVDGSELAEGAVSTRLAVGEHTLEVRADGFIAERRVVRIVGGEQVAVRIQLVPLAPPALAAPSPTREPRRWYKNPWFWGVTGVLVAGGVGTAVGLALRPEEAQQAAPYRGLSGEPPLTGPSQ